MGTGLRFGWQVLYRAEEPLFQRLSGAPFFRSSEPITYVSRIGATNSALYHPVEFHPTNLFHNELRSALKSKFGLDVREKNFPYTVSLELFEKPVQLSVFINLFLPSFISINVILHNTVELDKEVVFKQRQLYWHRSLGFIADFTARLVETQSRYSIMRENHFQPKTLIYLTADRDDREFLSRNRHLLAALVINDPYYEHTSTEIFDRIFHNNADHNKKHEKIRSILINKQTFLSAVVPEGSFSIFIKKEIRKKSYLFELGTVLQAFYDAYPHYRLAYKNEMDYLYYATKSYIVNSDFTFHLSYDSGLAWKVVIDAFRLSDGFMFANRFDVDASNPVREFFDQHPRPLYSDPAFWTTVRTCLGEENRSFRNSDAGTKPRSLPASPQRLVTTIERSGNTIQWLHLSDLHLCPPKTGWDAERVLRTLEADLKGMEEEHGLRPDMLFFIGDLAFGEVGTKPGETLTDQYDAAHMFLDRIRRSFHVEIPEENTFLVPGNHDIDRGCATRDQTEWLDRQTNLDMVTKLIQDKDIQWKRYMERLQAYKKFLEKGGFEHLLEDPERLVYGVQRLVNGARIGIAGLNSAWSCCRDAEKGKLWLAGAWQIGELHQQLTGTLFNIALIHHPLNWLVEHEDPRLEHNFRHEFRFLLHGTSIKGGFILRRTVLPGSQRPRAMSDQTTKMAIILYVWTWTPGMEKFGCVNMTPKAVDGSRALLKIKQITMGNGCSIT